MFIDPKCYDLAAHFLPHASEARKKDLAEMIQWTVDLELFDATSNPAKDNTDGNLHLLGNRSHDCIEHPEFPRRL